jgi:MFS family permease
MTAMAAAAPTASARHGIVLLTASVMPAMAIVSLVPVLPLLMREFTEVPGAAVLVPIMLTVPALCVALFSPLAGWVVDRIGRKPLLIGGLLGSRGPFGLYVLALPIALAAGIMLFEPAIRRHADERPHPFPLRLIMAPIAITLGVGLLFCTVLVQLGPILAVSGVTSPALMGVAGAAANIGIALGTAIFSRLSFGAGPRTLAVGLLIAALGYAGAGVAQGAPATAAFAVVACIGCGVLLPNMLTWPVRLLPPDARGRGTGSWTGMFFFGQFAAPIVAGPLAGPVGGLKSVLMLYAGLALLGALLAAFGSFGRTQLTR